MAAEQAGVVILNERVADRQGRWVTIWAAFRRGRVLRVEWATHLPYKVVVDSKDFKKRKRRQYVYNDNDEPLPGRE